VTFSFAVCEIRNINSFGSSFEGSRRSLIYEELNLQGESTIHDIQDSRNL